MRVLFPRRQQGAAVQGACVSFPVAAERPWISLQVIILIGEPNVQQNSQPAD